MNPRESESWGVSGPGRNSAQLALTTEAVPRSLNRNGALRSASVPLYQPVCWPTWHAGHRMSTAQAPRRHSGPGCSATASGASTTWGTGHDLCRQRS